MRKILFSLIWILILPFSRAEVRPVSLVLFSSIQDTVKADSLKTDSLKTTAEADSLAHIKKDTLNPIVIKPYFNFSSYLNRHEIDRSDYKYTGDLFKYFGSDYLRNFGFDGHPDVNTIYGAGSNGVSYFEDGILLNSRLLNNFDLNNFQSEYIDSIEVLPVTRGFLYGIYNNNASVVFHDRDFITKQPYSRIKYYQGPNGEALVDLIFNQIAYKKFKFSVDVTNRKFDSSYVNSSYSQWMVRGNIKYYLSDKWNMNAGYNYAKSKVGLNGGVKTDSVTNPAIGLTGQLYNERFANVNSPYQTQSYKSHLFYLRMLGNYSKLSYTDLVFYYNFIETDLNNNVDSIYYKIIDKEKLAGLNLDQRIYFGILNLNLRANYESGRLKYYSITNNNNNFYPVSYNNISVAPVLNSYLFDSTIVPSLFFKFSHNSFSTNYGTDGTYAGWGADITYLFSNVLKLYLGYSNYKPGPGMQYVYNYEVGAGLKTGYSGIDIKVFRRNNFSDYSRYSFLTDSVYTVSDLIGTSLDLKAAVWKIVLETHAYYYMNPKSSGLFYQLPQFNLNGGIYYENYLFNDNLNLKSGFAVNYTGKRKEPGYGILGADFNLDFTLAGEIQKVAYVYFTWENLLNNQYFLVPYYPMPTRNIRFGIAWELFN